uniref:Uncharacterized protein n=1 Tax=Physcomitrium patens TaxID=3218 RepID=A0A2K1KUE9_PHYPA|nr:hypothetical protein PHYPA_004416 [Physcomitrium patens]
MLSSFPKIVPLADLCVQKQARTFHFPKTNFTLTIATHFSSHQNPETSHGIVQNMARKRKPKSQTGTCPPIIVAPISDRSEIPIRIDGFQCEDVLAQRRLSAQSAAEVRFVGEKKGVVPMAIQ